MVAIAMGVSHMSWAILKGQAEDGASEVVLSSAHPVQLAADQVPMQS